MSVEQSDSGCPMVTALKKRVISHGQTLSCNALGKRRGSDSVEILHRPWAMADLASTLNNWALAISAKMNPYRKGLCGCQNRPLAPIRGPLASDPGIYSVGRGLEMYTRDHLPETPVEYAPHQATL